MPDKFEIGQQIVLSTGKDTTPLGTRLSNLNAAKAAFEYSARMLDIAQHDLWLDFYDQYPDLKGFDIRLQLEDTALIAVVIGQRRSPMVPHP